MNAPEEKFDKQNASETTSSTRLNIPGETGRKRSGISGENDSRYSDISGEKGSEISTSEGKGKSMENISGWLIHMLCEISPSLLESEAEIPECDLEKAFAADKTKEHGMSPQMEALKSTTACAVYYK